MEVSLYLPVWQPQEKNEHMCFLVWACIIHRFYHKIHRSLDITTINILSGFKINTSYIVYASEKHMDIKASIHVQYLHTTRSFLVPTTNLTGSEALLVASSIHRDILTREASSDKSNTTITTEIQYSFIKATLFQHENICCGYSLEVPHRGTSNEYQQHMFWVLLMLWVLLMITNEDTSNDH